MIADYWDFNKLNIITIIVLFIDNDLVYLQLLYTRVYTKNSYVFPVLLKVGSNHQLSR